MERNPHNIPVILDGVRTAFTKASIPNKHNGQLARILPSNLGATLVAELLRRNEMKGKYAQDVNAVLVGTAFPEGMTGLNEANMWVKHPHSGLPDTVSATTMNKFCGSNLATIGTAANAIASPYSRHEVIIAGGVENMSVNPNMMGARPMVNPLILGGDNSTALDMGWTAETLAEMYGIARDLQEEFAIASHAKALAAQRAGAFDDEIVPIEIVLDENGQETVNFGQGGEVVRVVSADDLIHDYGSHKEALETLAKLNPVKKNGTITAATASPRADGAAAVLVTSLAFAEKIGATPKAYVEGVGEQGCAMKTMGLGPVGASAQAMDIAGWKMRDVDLIEVNEAFAPQVLAVGREMNFDPSDPKRFNVAGGALALGHPLAASGGRITISLYRELLARNLDRGLASLCIGGGDGGALCLRRFEI